MLANGIDGNDVSWSPDSRYIYASIVGNGARIVRISAATGQVETAVDLSRLHPGNRSQNTDVWFAVAPDGALVLRQWQHESEIYAYNVAIR